MKSVGKIKTEAREVQNNFGPYFLKRLMPYKTVEEMEDKIPSVKNLTAHQKTIAMHIINESLKHGDDETTAIKMGIGAAKKVKASEEEHKNLSEESEGGFIFAEMIPGEHLSDAELALKEFEVLKCGEYTDPRYGKFRITPDILSAIKNHFDEKVLGRDAYLDENHEPEHKAVAWVKNLSIRGNSLFAQFDKFTQKGLDLFKQGVYRYFSVNFAPIDKVINGVKKTIPFVLKGIGMTNSPVITGMQPTFFSEGVQEPETEAEAQPEEKPVEAEAKVEEQINSSEAKTMDEKQLSELKAAQEVALAEKDKAIAEKELALAEATKKLAEMELAEKKAATAKFVGDMMLSESNLTGFTKPLLDKVTAFTETLSAEQRVSFAELVKGVTTIEEGMFAEKGEDGDGEEDGEDDGDDEDEEENKKLAEKVEKLCASFVKDGMKKTEALEKAQKEVMGKKMSKKLAKK